MVTTWRETVHKLLGQHSTMMKRQEIISTYWVNNDEDQKTAFHVLVCHVLVCPANPELCHFLIEDQELAELLAIARVWINEGLILTQ